MMQQPEEAARVKEKKKEELEEGNEETFKVFQL